MSGWGGDPYPTLPMVPGTEDNNPEVEHGPRADTGGCSACKTTELQAWGDYLLAYDGCDTHQSEAERKNCRRLAWIAYLDTVYDCFQAEGCFGA